jgi:hypothetical protein
MLIRAASYPLVEWVRRLSRICETERFEMTYYEAPMMLGFELHQ